MAKSKDFSTVGTNKLYSTIEQSTGKRGQQSTATPEEAAIRAAELRTQGRKGCKAVRINMAFTPDNHEFIKIMARASGKSMTEFANDVIAAYKKEHPEIIEKANEFLQLINSCTFYSNKN